MAITHKAARTAAQLHEAAQEVARLAALRSAQATGQPDAQPVPACPALANDRAELARLLAAEHENHEIGSVRLPVVPAAASGKSANIRVTGTTAPVAEACAAERAAGRP
jgi:predicted pyridoxine 5'-phosphate oxidase superfamily flavin-nucleotide-binding protein